MSNTEDDNGEFKTLVPQPLEFPLNKCALTINERCGSCLHFGRTDASGRRHGMAHPAYGKVCSDKGVQTTSIPCKRYSPDTSLIRIDDDELWRGFAKFLAACPDSKLGIVAATVNREKRTRKAGFVYGQIVYMNVFGPDYISNYRRCLVHSAENRSKRGEPEYIKLECDDHMASVYRTSVLSPKEWKKKRKELEARKRVMDPKYKTYFKRPSEAEQHKQKIIDDILPMLDAKDLKRTGVVLSKEDLAKANKNKRRAPHVAKERDIHTTGVDKLLRVRG